MSLEDSARSVIADSQAEELLTIKEFAALFRVSTRAVYYAIKDGSITFTVIRPLGTAPRIFVPTTIVQRLRATAKTA